MKTSVKKYLSPLAFLIIGLFIGWLIFGSSSNTESSKKSSDISSTQSVENNAKETIWTCSMHPQIRRKKPGKCPICGMTLIPLENANSTDENPAAVQMTEAAVRLANIQTRIARLERPEKELFLNGKIKIDERRIYNQIAHISGRIEKLYVNFEGQYVSKGQKIAAIYSPELFAAQKELLEAAKLKSSLPDLYKSAVEKLKLWKITDEQIREIVKNGKVKSQIDILADVSGFVVKQNAFLGSQIKRGDVLFKIADLKKVWVVLDAYETDLIWIKKGDLVKFAIPSLPGKEFRAKISHIDPVIDAKTRTVKVWSEIDNSDGVFKPETFVYAKLKAKLPFKEKKIILPKTAVLWTGKRSVVYVKLPNKKYPTFEMREVVLGNDLGKSYIIEKGIKPGEEIAVYGTFKIDAAAQLAGKFSSMNRK